MLSRGKVLWLLVLGLVVFSLESRAADGDACKNETTGAAHESTQAWCVMLCDDKTGNTTCAELDTKAMRYHTATAKVTKSVGCTNYTVTIQDRAVGDGEWSIAETMTFGGITSVSFGSYKLSRFVRAQLIGMAGPCTDLDVTMEFYR